MNGIKNNLTRQDILSTGDWYLSTYSYSRESYFWTHKSIEEDGENYELIFNTTDWSATIMLAPDDNIVFDGYIQSLEELKQVTHLCRLHE